MADFCGSQFEVLAVVIPICILSRDNEPVDLVINLVLLAEVPSLNVFQRVQQYA
jgi:hypothetical protein